MDHPESTQVINLTENKDTPESLLPVCFFSPKPNNF